MKKIIGFYVIITVLVIVILNFVYVKRQVSEGWWQGHFATLMIMSDDGTYMLTESSVFGNKLSGRFPAITLAGKWEVQYSGLPNKGCLDDVVIKGIIEHSLFSEDTGFIIGKSWLGKIRCETYARLNPPASYETNHAQYEIFDIYTGKDADNNFLSFQRRI